MSGLAVVVLAVGGLLLGIRVEARNRQLDVLARRHGRPAGRFRDRRRPDTERRS